MRSALKVGYARVDEKGEVVATWKLPKQIGAGLLTIAGMVALVAAGRALILFMFFVLAMLIVAAPHSPPGGNGTTGAGSARNSATADSRIRTISLGILA